MGREEDGVSFIHGAVAWREGVETVRGDVEQMLNALEHYPWVQDDLAVAASDGASVVLALQASPARGPSAGRTVWRSDDQALTIAADVRLDDRLALAKQVGLTAADARGCLDSELVLRAYRRWGVDCPKHLLGVGAFIVWDAEKQRLLCSRDVAGVRPLYYFQLPGRAIIVSSDLQSLMAHPGIPGKLDLAYARSLLESGQSFQHPTRTLCDGVRKLAAGHRLTATNEAVNVEPYWQPGDVSRRDHGDEREYAEELGTLLRAAVACRLPETEDGVGAHLSGGLDSSSIAVLASRALTGSGRRLVGFSWAPPWQEVPEQPKDERLLAEMAATYGEVPLHYTTLAAADVVAHACRDIALQPTTTLHLELASSRDAASAGIRTMLSGWGGDELVVFNGRGLFADLARRGHLVTVQRELRQRQQIHGGSMLGAWRHRVLDPLLPDMASLGPRHGDRTEAAFPSELRPEFAALLSRAEPLESMSLRERPGVHAMQTALLANGHLQYRLEAWAAHGATLGLEYAFPLLDQRLIEFALSVPDHLFFKNGWKRWLYRTAMDGVLPDAVRWHPDKHDLALEVQARGARARARENLISELRMRGSNPFIDVERYLAANDRQGRSSGTDDPARMGTPFRPQDGSASWLAFTRLSPP
jgi:asparagine synthase (glutamine-hydrolysing)